MTDQFERTHLSPAHVGDLHEISPTLGDDFSYKPHGFWYQVDGDWERWMTDEEWAPRVYDFVYSVDLGDVNMLTIRTAAEMGAVAEQYAVGMPWHQDDHEQMLAHGTLDWARIAQEYDGMEIAPYIWERRMTYMWYYGWDCASGVIWRPRNTTVKLLREYTGYGSN